MQQIRSASAASPVVGAECCQVAKQNLKLLQAAVDMMRKVLNTVNMDGVIVIGEGEKDEVSCWHLLRTRTQYVFREKVTVT